MTTLGKLFTVVYGVIGLGLVSLSVGVIAREIVRLRQKEPVDKEQESNAK